MKDVLELIEQRHYHTKLPWGKERGVRGAYRADQRRLVEELKADAIEYCGLKGHPKAEKAWDFAWEERHHSGFREVVEFLEELADLIK